LSFRDFVFGDWVILEWQSSFCVTEMPKSRIHDGEIQITKSRNHEITKSTPPPTVSYS